VLGDIGGQASISPAALQAAPSHLAPATTVAVNEVRHA
jgi:hypothetical protein